MRFSILVPDATVNYIKNPSMRYGTTDWNSAGATLTRTLEQARFGIASLKVVTAGTALRQGIYYRVSALVGVSEPITVSAYARGAGRVRIRLIDNPSGKEWASQGIQLESDRWYRLSVSGFSTGSNDLRLYVETDEKTATARTFYIDGAQLERKSYPTTYCDGDQPGCRWIGLAHNGTSSRDPATRAGGRWVQLAGKEREAQDLYMTVAGGLGVAPVANHVGPFFLAPGSYFQNMKINARPITLTFHAKHRVDPENEEVSLAHLHQLRQMLIDVVKPGREEIWFEYADGDRPMYFRARYEGGLGGEWDVRNQFINSFPLRLLATSPLMSEDSQEVQVLDFQDQVLSVNVMGRIDGIWNIMNYGMNNSVADLEFGRKGELVAGGAFDIVNYDPDAIDPFRDSDLVTYWDGQKWVQMVPGSSGGLFVVNDVAIAANGDIYVTGDFTSIGGVAANRIARWNGSAWSALGTGLNNDGIHISIDARGNLYVGGDFTTAGGITANRIARWDGSKWHGLGQYNGFNNQVFSIAVSPDGDYLYVGGAFTDQNGNPGSGLNRIAYYDVATDRFSAVGNGFNANVLEVILAPSGVLYACGDFTLSGSDTINRIGKFVGGGWVPLGSGMNNTVNSFDVGINGDIVAVGAFSRADDVAVRNIAFWNGSSWTNFDVELDAVNPAIVPLAVQYAPNGDVYLGGSWGESPSLFSGINYVTNQGSAEALPTIYILGPGRLRWIENQTTRKRVFFDLEIEPSEEVFIDFLHGSVFSTVRGDLFHAMLPGSDFHFFTLIPGENKLACFMVNDVNAQMQISYTPTHWGVDAMMESPLEAVYA